MSDATDVDAGGFQWVVLLPIGSLTTLLGWGGTLFAVGMRCEPTPCPTPVVFLAALGVALVGTVLLAVGCVGAARETMNRLQG